MQRLSYIGSGPYCYANSLAMVLGKHGPSTAVIEFATSAPFGMQPLGDTSHLPLFSPYAWTPVAGLKAALATMGWGATEVVGKDADDALAQLKTELQKTNGSPVLVGPIDIGCLRYQPGMEGPIGSDHYVVVLRVDAEMGMVELHDPHGFPYTSLPVSDFMEAWKAEKLGYGPQFMMHTGFRRVLTGDGEVSEEEVIRKSIPLAIRWLSMDVGDEKVVPSGTVANRLAAERLADMVESGLPPDIRGHLVYFAVRVGARRAADAATCLARTDYDDAARIMTDQAKLIGGLQYPLVSGDKATAARLLRTLAPTYDELRMALDQP